jgi:ABC-type nitrate/sulfonate/bicarbonate transport system substrate-binding protein
MSLLSSARHQSPRRTLFAASVAVVASVSGLVACSSKPSSPAAQGSSSTSQTASSISASAPSSAAQSAPGKNYSFTVLESTPGFFDLPLRVAIADFAAKYNLSLKIVTVTGGGALATEFEGGTGTVAMVGVDTPLRLQQQNGVAGGVTIIGTNMTHMLYALVSKSGSKYRQLSDLRGANVAITGAGAASQVVLNWALINQANMKTTDVKEVPLGAPPTILAAVEKGSVAAGTVFSPALDEGLASGAVQLAFDFRKYPYAQNVFMARTKAVDADPTPYKLFMQAYTDAVNKMESDPAYALTNAKRYWGQGTDDKTLQSELDFYMNQEWKGTTFPESLYNASRDVLLKSGSGFPSTNFPSYEDMTKNAPTIG